MQKLIDSISGIDLAAVQPEQLCRKHGTFRCNSTGSGRDKKYSYRHGASTPIGDIEDSVWKTAAEAVVKRDGLEQEVAQIKVLKASRICGRITVSAPSIPPLPSKPTPCR